jgi:diaminopimelate epimerase
VSAGAGSAGRRFVKMSGSGNDFILFDARHEPAADLESPAMIRELCARGTGIGADGVVFLVPSETADFGIRYYNADGSLASLCGNASLCSTRLAAELGIASAGGMRFETGAGTLSARLRDADRQPEIDLEPVTSLRLSVDDIPLQGAERRVGYAVAGVPHLVILCDDVEAVNVAERGPGLRSHPAVGPEGANVNWVSPRPGAGADQAWAIRTFERGVEGETLACGTGAVASAAVLAAWGQGPASGTSLTTRSGRTLRVSLNADGSGAVRPSLSGEGRVVFRGELGEL